MLFRFFPKRKTPLEHLQTRLLALLYSGLAPENIKEILLTDRKLSDYHDYIRTMDLDMVKVGSELTRKWGNRVEHSTTPES